MRKNVCPSRQSPAFLLLIHGLCLLDEVANGLMPSRRILAAGDSLDSADDLLSRLVHSVRARPGHHPRQVRECDDRYDEAGVLTQLPRRKDNAETDVGDEQNAAEQEAVAVLLRLEDEHEGAVGDPQEIGEPQQANEHRHRPNVGDLRGEGDAGEEEGHDRRGDEHHDERKKDVDERQDECGCVPAPQPAGRDGREHGAEADDRPLSD